MRKTFAVGRVYRTSPASISFFGADFRLEPMQVVDVTLFDSEERFLEAIYGLVLLPKEDNNEMGN